MREAELHGALALFLRYALPVGAAPDPETVIRKFWDRVERGAPDECWLWRGALNRPGGYGFLSLGGGRRGRANIYAHRLALVHSGRAVKPNDQACHHCDTPQCVNPAHLFVGTRSENMRDAARKGRVKGYAKGSLPPKTRLHPPAVIEIRRLLNCGGLTQKQIAKRFGVTEACIQHINVGRTWRSVA